MLFYIEAAFPFFTSFCVSGTALGWFLLIPRIAWTKHPANERKPSTINTITAVLSSAALDAGAVVVALSKGLRVVGALVVGGRVVGIRVVGAGVVGTGVVGTGVVGAGVVGAGVVGGRVVGIRVVGAGVVGTGVVGRMYGQISTRKPNPAP